MQRRLHTFTSMFFRQCRAGATLSPVAAVSKALQVTGCDEGSHSAGKDYDVQILPIDQSTYDQSGNPVVVFSSNERQVDASPEMIVALRIHYASSSTWADTAAVDRYQHLIALHSQHSSLQIPVKDILKAEGLDDKLAIAEDYQPWFEQYSLQNCSSQGTAG